MTDPGRAHGDNPNPSLQSSSVEESIVSNAAADDWTRLPSQRNQQRDLASRSEWHRTLDDPRPPTAFLPAAETTLPVDPRLVEACAQVALKLGGPGLTRLGVTSALRGEGRTTVALAMAALQTREFNRRALLIDADFDNPTLGEAFGLAGERGLAEVTTGELSIDTAVREVAEGIAFLPAGRATKHRSRMVRELFSTDLLDELSGLYEVAIVDLPPLLGTVDGPLLAAHFPNALLVVRAKVTPLSQVSDAIGMLKTPPYVLLNGVDSAVPRWLSRLVDHG